MGKLSQRSDTAAAVRYALARWDALLLYAGDGAVEIDDNAVEREIRPVALGRKNYLFAGSGAGGDRTAAAYSLIGSAKLNGLDPDPAGPGLWGPRPGRASSGWRGAATPGPAPVNEAYMRHVLDRIAEHPVNRIAELLSWNLTTA